MTKARTLADFDASTALSGNINLATQVTGLLPLANGGTGATSVPAGGIAQMSQWRLTTNIVGDQDPLGSWEEADDPTYSRVGSAFTYNSDGTFNFPATGKYLVLWDVACNNQTDVDASVAWEIYASTDTGSSWDRIARNTESFPLQNRYKNTNLQAVVNVANTSTFKLKFTTSGHPTVGIRTNGGSDTSFGGITFIKVSD
jgi:hypothetical protein